MLLVRVMVVALTRSSKRSRLTLEVVLLGKLFGHSEATFATLAFCVDKSPLFLDQAIAILSLFRHFLKLGYTLLRLLRLHLELNRAILSLLCFALS